MTGDSGEWITTGKAATILGVHRQTVLRSLNDEVRRRAEWGAEGDGWRYQPLTRIFQVRREVAERMARGADT